MLSDLLGSSRYAATMKCLTNDSVIASLYLLADLVLLGSLMACGYMMWSRRKTGYYLLPFQARLVSVCVFLVAASVLMEIVTLFDGVYRLEILLRAAAAGISVMVAFSCWNQRP